MPILITVPRPLRQSGGAIEDVEGITTGEIRSQQAVLSPAHHGLNVKWVISSFWTGKSNSL